MANKIDWKTDKLQTIMELLEKEGCYKETNQDNEIKKTIMKITKNCKMNILPEFEALNIIYNNLETLDHHDCVRIDQILTIMYNEKENDYQWASVCMNQKWKKI